MILKALYDLAQAEHLVDDPDYITEEVAYCLSIGDGGRNPRLLYLGVEREDGKNRRLELPRILIPLEPKRQGMKAPSLFLLDKASFLFGLDPSKSDAEKLARFRQEALRFRERTIPIRDALLAGTVDHAAVSALVDFLNLPEQARHSVVRDAYDCAATAKQKHQLVSKPIYVVFAPEGVTPIHLLPEVQKHWRLSRERSKAAGRTTRCLVTGQLGPMVRLHGAIKGVPGAQSSGVPLVSFNKDSFKSLDLLGNDNAPIAQATAEGCACALNRLLARRPSARDGALLPRQNLVLSSDTVAVFWSRTAKNLSWLLSLGDSPEAVAETLRAPLKGTASALTDPEAFYTLVLSGAEGRIALRSFIATQTKDVAHNVLRYLDDACVDRPFAATPGTYPLPQLLRSLAPLGDIGRLAPGLASAAYLAAITGAPVPRSVLDAAVCRNRIQGPGPSRPNAKEEYEQVRAFAARCSLVRLSLIRPPYNQEELAVSFDPGNRQPPYLLGRLLAILDAIQRDANPKVNATVVDRFYGSASSTPMVAFPTLLRLNQHHLSKLRKERAGLAISRERLLQDAMTGLGQFPRTMPLEAQGLFALGFHHQRQALFVKKGSTDQEINMPAMR